MQNSQKKVTLKTIAQELDISFSTVSKALNNDPAIKDETREMVIKKADELGYAPNVFARALRTNSSKTIAAIFNDIENPVLTYIFKEISVYMALHGYTTLISDSQFEFETERSSVLSITSHVPDVAIISPATHNDYNIQYLIDNGVAVILFDDNKNNLACHCVDVDYAYGGYISARELLSKGHRHILIVTEPLEYPYSSYYLAGIKKAFEEFHCPFDEKYLHYVHSSLEDTYQLIKSLWNAQEREFTIFFTAVMCFGDNFALGVYKAIDEFGLSVPEDVSVIGFDDNEICSFTSPALTSVHLPRSQMAKSCLEILENVMLHEGTPAKYKFSLSPHLVIRDSVKEL